MIEIDKLINPDWPLSEFENLKLQIATLCTEVLTLSSDKEHVSHFGKLEQEYFAMRRRVGKTSKSTAAQLLFLLDDVNTVIAGKKREIIQKYLHSRVDCDKVSGFFKSELQHYFVLDSSEDLECRLTDILDLYYYFWSAACTTLSINGMVQMCETRENPKEKIKIAFIRSITYLMQNLGRPIIEESSCLSEEQKDEYIQKTRKEFPNAPKSNDHLLKGKVKFESIKEAFLPVVQSTLEKKLAENLDHYDDNDVDTVQIAVYLSFIIFLIMDVAPMQDLFIAHVKDRLHYEFQKSSHRKANDAKSKVPVRKQAYINNVLASFQPSQKLLPEELKQHITKFLSTCGSLKNGELETAQKEIERQLQRRYNKWAILRKSWLKEKFPEYGQLFTDDFFQSLEWFGFVCEEDPIVVDNQVIGETADTNNDKTPEPSAQETKTKAERDALMVELDKMTTEEYVDWLSWIDLVYKRVEWFTEIFKKLGYVFIDQQKFIETATNQGMSSPKLMKDFYKTLMKVLQFDTREKKKELGFYTFELSFGRRIYLCKRWTIDMIGNHDEYETYYHRNTK